MLMIVTSRFTAETELGSGPVRLHHRCVGAARIDGQDMDPLALQFATQGFSEPGETRLGGGVGGIEWRADQGDSRGDIDHHCVTRGAE